MDDDPGGTGYFHTERYKRFLRGTFRKEGWSGESYPGCPVCDGDRSRGVFNCSCVGGVPVVSAPSGLGGFRRYVLYS